MVRRARRRMPLWVELVILVAVMAAIAVRW